jgi:hypothetical protein
MPKHIHGLYLAVWVLYGAIWLYSANKGDKIEPE